MGRRRNRAAGLVALAIGLLAAACDTPPPGAPAAADVLAARTRGEVLRATTLEPTRCTWSRPGYELCAWKLGDRNSAWYALAASIDTRYKVNLLCEFATPNGPRERDCLLVPAASPPTVGAAGRPHRTTRAEAQARLEAATTVWAVTDLVGDAPTRCSEVDAQSQFCVWQATKQTQGYAALLSLLEVRGRLQLSCSFAKATGERVGACRAQPF